MEYLWQIHYDYNWAGLLRNMLLLGFVLGVAWLANWLLRRLPTPNNWQQISERLLSYFLLLFEPLAVLVLGSYFVLIHPFFHGLIVLLLLVTNFSHLRNYFSGRVVRFDSASRIGNRLSSQQTTGLITKIGRLGLRLLDRSLAARCDLLGLHDRSGVARAVGRVDDRLATEFHTLS
ncbi:MAG: hypothetical protein AAGJ82_04830, partial [Bacteroidota bacterium]